MPVSIASIADIPQMLPLVNSAYRGDASRAGWTTEADLLLGDQRIDEPGLNEMMNKPGAVFLKYEAEGRLLGIVYLEKQAEKLYLGMLSVSPQLQGGGIGKQLMKASEAHALEMDCRAITMQVISVRTELIDWYKRHGYSPTGEMRPFLVGIHFGEPTRDLEFMVLEKDIHN